MQFDGALVKEQGVCFAIAVVKPHVWLKTHEERPSMMADVIL